MWIPWAAKNWMIAGILPRLPDIDGLSHGNRRSSITLKIFFLVFDNFFLLRNISFCLINISSKDQQSSGFKRRSKIIGVIEVIFHVHTLKSIVCYPPIEWTRLRATGNMKAMGPNDFHGMLLTSYLKSIKERSIATTTETCILNH